MANYYPIEFLPENKELGNPNTRNFFRNNLPFQPITDTGVDENSVADFGKQITYLESSITNNPVKNKNEVIVEKSILNNKTESNSNLAISNTKSNKPQTRCC
jgi:hypothetical protein